MFEAAYLSEATAAPAGALRSLDWGELVARLSASRDLRAVFAPPTVCGGGFVPQTAAGIASEAAREPGVNLGALATGKCADHTIAAAVRTMGRGDRDKR
jgi:hypothetical protein